MTDDSGSFNVMPMEEDVVSSASHPGTVHRILSKIPYGEEDEAFLKAVSTEVALQVPWTTQLRLCLRSPTTLHKLLLPHVWNRVQHHLQDGDGVDDGHHDASGYIFEESWKQDAMFQNWRLTRFHIQRDLRLIPRTLRQIMERIDSVLGIESELTLSYDGDHLSVKAGKPPLLVLREYRQEKYIELASASEPATLHRNFSSWVADHAEYPQQQDTCLELCRQIGLNRSKLNLVEEHLHCLPIQRMARGLLLLQSTNDEVIQKGRALCAAFLKRRGADIRFDPLPPEMILWDSQHVAHLIKSFLHMGLPNVNSLVVYLWAHQNMEMVVQFSSWLPVEPVVPLLQRSLTQTDSNWEQGIDFFLALPWEQHHLQETFAPLLGTNVPTDPAALKQACRIKIMEKDAVVKSIRRQTSQLSTNELVEQVWGKADIQRITTEDKVNHGDSVTDFDMSDDDFDETDDRVLLL